MINIFTIAIFISFFIGGLANKETIELNNFTQRSNVIVLNKKVKIQDEIKLILNGKLAASGDCQPTIKLGLIKKNNINDWDTLVNINNLGTLQCGFGLHNWCNDTITISLFNYTFINNFRKRTEISGIYCFTYMEIKKYKTVVCKSNEFEIIQ
jgi:hypothetical protein